MNFRRVFLARESAVATRVERAGSGFNAPTESKVRRMSNTRRCNNGNWLVCEKLKIVPV